MSTERKPVDYAETQPKVESVSRWKKNIGIFGVALALGGGLSACSTEATPGVQTSPTTASETVGSPDVDLAAVEAQKALEVQKNFDAFITSFQMTTDKYPTPEAATAAFVENYAKYLNAGLTENTDLTLLSGDENIMIPLVEGKYDAAIAENLFTNDASGQELAARIQTSLREAVIKGYLLSVVREDPIKYAMDMQLISTVVTSSDSTGFTVQAVIRETDNGNDNIGDALESQGAARQTDILRYDTLMFVISPEGVITLSNDTFYQESQNNSQ